MFGVWNSAVGAEDIFVLNALMSRTAVVRSAQGK